MKTKTLSAIVKCVSLLLVHGLGSNTSHAKGAVAPSSRIINGEVADPADFPFVMRLQFRDPLENITTCSGSIINNYFILTAAHCLFNEDCAEIEILPANSRSGDIPRFQIAQCFLHEKFNDTDFEFDIALMQTRQDLLEDGTLKAIPLPDPDIIYPPGVPAVIVGWGLREDGTYPDQLLRADVVIYDWFKCNDDFENADYCGEGMNCPVVGIPTYGICTIGLPPNYPGSCVGDSGGPAIIDGVLAGVMSGMVLDVDVCRTESPTLHMNVASFVSWMYVFIQ